jgi:hypothetical protein
MKDIDETFVQIKSIYKLPRNNSPMLAQKRVSVFIDLYRQFQKMILVLHNIIRAMLGYPKRRSDKKHVNKDR